MAPIRCTRMVEAHRVAGYLVLGCVGAFTLACVAAALLGGWRGRLQHAYVATQAVVGAQVLLGLVVLIGERTSPREPLHMLYALLVVGVLAFANSFSAQAPPKARAWTFALAGVIAFGLVLRLFGTG